MSVDSRSPSMTGSLATAGVAGRMQMTVALGMECVTSRGRLYQLYPHRYAEVLIDVRAHTENMVNVDQMQS